MFCSAPAIFVVLYLMIFHECIWLQTSRCRRWRWGKPQRRWTNTARRMQSTGSYAAVFTVNTWAMLKTPVSWLFKIIGGCTNQYSGKYYGLLQSMSRQPILNRPRASGSSPLQNSEPDLRRALVHPLEIRWVGGI